MQTAARLLILLTDRPQASANTTLEEVLKVHMREMRWWSGFFRYPRRDRPHRLVPRDFRNPPDPALCAAEPECRSWRNVALVVKGTGLDRYQRRRRCQNRHNGRAATPAETAFHRRPAVADILIARQRSRQADRRCRDDDIHGKGRTTCSLAVRTMANHRRNRVLRDRVANRSAQASSVTKRRVNHCRAVPCPGQSTDNPPSIVNSAPVMNAASSEERKAMPPTISSATAQRPSGNFCSIIFFAVSTSGNRPAWTIS